MAKTQRTTTSSFSQENPFSIARVALYARVSTLNGQDPEMQLRELREYASRRGCSVEKEYIDQGTSGSKESRPALNDLMADAQRRKFDAVLVWKIDRIGRSLRHLVPSGTGRARVAFVSFGDNLDLSTPSGRLMFQIIGAMAEFERALIQERVRAGLRNARAKAEHLGRPRVAVDASQDCLSSCAGTLVGRNRGRSKGRQRHSAAGCCWLAQNCVAAIRVFYALESRGDWLRSSKFPYPDRALGDQRAHGMLRKF